MKIAIIGNHSHGNESLARLTSANRWCYSAKHGYDLLTLRMEWEPAKVDFLRWLKRLLPLYDAVLTIGSDVVFTNTNITIESILQPSDKIVLCREEIGSSSINNDVMLWVNHPDTLTFLDQLIEAAPVWLVHSWMWQWWLAERLRDTPAIASIVRLVPARVMNSHWQNRTTGTWQPGDFILHALCGGLEQKKRICAEYLAKVDTA